jgi:prepilin-type N-terminal cleavage/methylation domain-containing protein
MKISTIRAFTLVEILIAIAIIAVILSITVPNYVRSREESHKNGCIVNLRQINSAIDQWAMENKISTGSVPSDEQEEGIYGYIKSVRPRCHGGGTYTIHAVGDAEQVTCSLSGKGHGI